MSQVGSALSNGLGGTYTPQVQYPYFQSQGGVTPYQANAAQFAGAEDAIAKQSTFADSGTGMSTMMTQGGGVGPQNLQAADLMQASDANQQAQYSAQTNAENIMNQNISNQQNANNANISAGKNQISGISSLLGQL